MRDLLQAGQRAILKMGGGGHLYVVRIERVDDDQLVVSVPVPRGWAHPVEKGTRVQIEFHRRGKMYWFQTTVEDRQPGFPLLSLRLAPPAEIHQVQRREHVRWSVSLPVVVECAGGGEVWGRAVDLSGGGLAADLPGQWQQGQEVRVRLSLRADGLQQVDVVARVVRVSEPEEPGPGGGVRTLRVALEFTRITPAAREAIIRYVFRRQREFLRSGLAGWRGGAR